VFQAVEILMFPAVMPVVDVPSVVVKSCLF
jgi:hypothetical protein